MSGDRDEQDRPFDPTPRRRQQARDAGDVARSATLAAAAGWFVGLAVLRYVGPTIAQRIAELGVRQWGTVPSAMAGREMAGRQALVGQLQHGLTTTVVLAGPILMAVVVALVACHLLQCGWLWLPDRLALRPDRLGPASTWQRFGGGETLHGAWRNLLQVSAGIVVVLWTAWTELPEFLLALEQHAPPLGLHLFYFVIDTALRAGLAWLTVGLADYAWVWHRHEQRLRMTRDEAREEARGE